MALFYLLGSWAFLPILPGTVVSDLWPQDVLGPWLRILWRFVSSIMAAELHGKWCCIACGQRWTMMMSLWGTNDFCLYMQGRYSVYVHLVNMDAAQSVVLECWSRILEASTRVGINLLSYVSEWVNVCVCVSNIFNIFNSALVRSHEHKPCVWDCGPIAKSPPPISAFPVSRLSLVRYFLSLLFWAVFQDNDSNLLSAVHPLFHCHDFSSSFCFFFFLHDCYFLRPSEIDTTIVQL